MKLLGWMHRKFRQNNGEVYKDFGGGGGGACNCISGRPSLDEELHRRRQRQYEPFHARSLRLDGEGIFDAGCGGGGGDPAMEELFGGLLTIGTLGVGSWAIEEKEEEGDVKVTAEVEKEKPSVGTTAVEDLIVTPAELEAIAEKEAEATTETDLMVVGAELEKVLAAEAEKGGGARISARISSARSSQAGSAACPLQGFLFGTPIEVADTMEAAAMAAAAASTGRKERRASLGELFMMSRIAEERGGKQAEDAKFDGEEKAETYLVKKKMAKRRGLKGSDGGSTAETKIQKILQMFHRKVHPESSIMAKKSSKAGGKIEKKDYVPLINGECRKDQNNFPSSHAFGGNDSTCNKEHWIKTDADYLVLEL